MPATSTSGTKIFIGTAKATPNGTATEFASDTYKAVAGLTNLGELGTSYEMGSSDRIDTGAREKFKGVRDFGEVEVTCQYLQADQGQAAMETACTSNNAYNFKVTLSDAKTFYFKAFVSSSRIVTGGIMDPVTCAYTLSRTDFDNIPAA